MTDQEILMKCVIGVPPKNTRLGRTEAIVLNNIAAEIHRLNEKWWVDIETGAPKDRNVGEMICLMHSELSEALEAYRKNLMDDKLPTRTGLQVELADCIIRILDMAHVLCPGIGEALVEKCEYNAVREDHKIENRRGEHGKKF